MGYTKIKSITIKKNKVYITGADSNISPITYTKEESFSLSDLLAQEGREELDKHILYRYLIGMYHGVGRRNNYDKTIRVNDIQFNYSEVSENDNARQVLLDQLYALYIKFKKRDKVDHVIYDNISNVYVTKLTANYIYNSALKKDAKVFSSYEDAKSYGLSLDRTQYVFIPV